MNIPCGAHYWRSLAVLAATARTATGLRRWNLRRGRLQRSALHELQEGRPGLYELEDAIIPFLAGVPLFRVLPPRQLQELALGLKVEKYKMGEHVITQGDDGDCMFILWCGKASARIDTAEGQTVGTTYSSGNWFGEIAILQMCKRAATIVCDTPVTVLRLDRSTFSKIHPAARRAMSLLGIIRYASARRQRAAKAMLVLTLSLQFIGALFLILPLSTSWLFVGRYVASAIRAACGLNTPFNMLALFMITCLFMRGLREAGPVVGSCIACAAQLMAIRGAPPWQISLVEQALDPLIRTVRLALVCLMINAAVTCLPQHVAVFLMTVGPGYSRKLGIRTADDFFRTFAGFTEGLLSALVSFNCARYLLKILEPPNIVTMKDASPPGTLARTIERYYAARRDPRSFKDERYVDIVTSLNRVGSALIVVFALLPWFRLFGLEPSRVMALGGIGSLAFGFASKEVLENLVSGSLLHVSKPFVQGDRIAAESGNGFHGTVRKVGIAYSQIVRDDGQMLFVPNSVLLKKAIVNRSQVRFRRVWQTFQVILPEMGQVADLCEQIHKALCKHPEVMSKSEVAMMKKQDRTLRIFPPRCGFEGYGPQGANISIEVYVTGDGDNYAFKTTETAILLRVNTVIEQFGGSIGFEAHHIAKV